MHTWSVGKWVGVLGPWLFHFEAEVYAAVAALADSSLMNLFGWVSLLSEVLIVSRSVSSNLSAKVLPVRLLCFNGLPQHGAIADWSTGDGGGVGAR